MIEQKLKLLCKNNQNNIYFANIFKNNDTIESHNNKKLYIGNLEGYLEWFYNNFL
jgi:hypothetical protein